ncbi:glutamate--tRNA ligase family protein [Shigella flexneri]
MVVDDHFQGVSEIVRGADFDRTDSAANLAVPAFGWKVPDYIHLPLALNPQGADSSRIMRLRCRKAIPRPVLIRHFNFSVSRQKRTGRISASANPPVSRQKLAAAVPESAIVKFDVLNASC